MPDSLGEFAVTALVAAMGCFICGSVMHIFLNEIMGMGVSEGGCMLLGAAVGVAILKTMPQ